MTSDLTATMSSMFAAVREGDADARFQLADLLDEQDRWEEAGFLRDQMAIVVCDDNTVRGLEPGDYRASDYGEWAFALELIHHRHEPTYCNQDSDDGDDGSGRGEWFVADDLALTIIYGTYSSYNSPGASDYTYAVVYERREFYLAGVARWEAKHEYLEREDPFEDERDPEDFAPERYERD